MIPSKRIARFFCVALAVLCISFAFYIIRQSNASVLPFASAMPFYDLQPKELTLRASFHTSYPASSEERKNNIKVASKSLNNTLIDSNCEFSFNDTVGKRTLARGYKTAKIIFNGKFVDGVGGGVCQVSTTLYNAVLLSGLSVTEYHPHSLPVSYVAPSFDAMVNSDSADLKFINNTHNPVFIKTYADDSTLKIEIYGEPMQETYTRQSIVKSEIVAPDYEIIKDTENLYPDLFEGDRKIISYAKNGYASQGILIKLVNGKAVSSRVIRNDKYNPLRGVMVEGVKKRPETESAVLPETAFNLQTTFRYSLR